LRHVVLICIDTVGADIFFSPLMEDELASRLKSAQVYRNANSVAPWTIPAVSSTFTGLYPVQHKAGEFPTVVANLDTDLPSVLNPAAVTLAEMLQEQDFLTALFSSHPWLAADIGMQQGFGQIHSRKGWQKVVGRFEEWLDQPRQRPRRLFGYLHFMEAHDWHLKSRPDLEARLAELDDALRNDLLADASEAACADPNSDICLRNLVYNLAVRNQRQGLRAVLDSLEQRGLLQDTLVMVYSDHGEEFWEHKAKHEQRGDPRGIYGFGHGHSLYQELLHIPLVAWHPGLAGGERQDLVSLVDVVPSILDWLGLDQPDYPLPGRTLPTSRDPVPDPATERILYASGIAYGPRAVAVREGDAKSIMTYPDETFEYYDLAADPDERTPVSGNQLTMRFDVLTGDYLEMKSELTSALPQISEAQLEHLKSIGYLQGVEEPPQPNQKPADHGESEAAAEEGPPE
jgi:arylsulfatase A-like enzyme